MRPLENLYKLINKKGVITRSGSDEVILKIGLLPLHRMVQGRNDTHLDNNEQ